MKNIAHKQIAISCLKYLNGPELRAATTPKAWSYQDSSQGAISIYELYIQLFVRASPQIFDRCRHAQCFTSLFQLTSYARPHLDRLYCHLFRFETTHQHREGDWKAPAEEGEAYQPFLLWERGYFAGPLVNRRRAVSGQF
jgi:hypothetical protein